MRLTADLIERSASFINAVDDRELDLRGNRIPAIENFAAIRDQYDTIDLTDNEIRKLENFPKMSRLRNLFVSNNQIVKIEPDFAEKLLSIECVMLNNNKIEEISDIEVLENCKTLRYLSLMDNPLTKKPHYRLSLIAKLPWLRALDFRKVSDEELKAAKNLSSAEDVSEASGVRRGKKAAPSEPVSRPKSKRQKLPVEEIAKIKEQIVQAESLEEIARLEKLLQSGYS